MDTINELQHHVFFIYSTMKMFMTYTVLLVLMNGYKIEDHNSSVVDYLATFGYLENDNKIKD